ncbi:hypothetical protein C1646_765957 [Rhizophagus diaphanus]|nr:hypothetical protein C1646_765957 [Rhizophagus diaphanus] [Rhizophagus sp. MUCL 43196]
MAGPSTSQASASQKSFLQMNENLVHIAEDSKKMQVPEDTDDIDPEDTDDIDSEDADDIDSKDL